MSWDKLNKDVIQKILLEIEGDKDFLDLVLLNKKTYRCYDESLFMNRILKKYPGAFGFKKVDQSWRQFFLFVSHYVYKMKEKFGFDYTDGDPCVNLEILNLDEYEDMDVVLGQASTANLTGLTKFYLNTLMKNLDSYDEYDVSEMLNGVLVAGVKNNNFHIVDLAIFAGVEDVDSGFFWALNDTNDIMIDYLIKNGIVGNNTKCLQNSLMYKNDKWIKYFMQQDYTEDEYLIGAVLANGKDIWINHFIPSGEVPLDWYQVSQICRGGNLNCILALIDSGVELQKIFEDVINIETLKELEKITGFIPDWDTVFCNAASSESLDICEYAIEKGADSFTEAIICALGDYGWKSVDYIISLNVKVDEYKIIAYLLTFEEKHDYVFIKIIEKYIKYFEGLLKYRSGHI